MKKGMLFGLMFGIALMAAIFAIPALAHGPSTTTAGDGIATTQLTEDTWKNMWNACQSGDWDTMIEAMDEFHGEGFGAMMPMMMGGYGNGWNTTPDDTADTPADADSGSSTGWWDKMNDFMGGSGNGWGNMMDGGSGWNGMGGMMGGSGFGGMMGW